MNSIIGMIIFALILWGVYTVIRIALLTFGFIRYTRKFGYPSWLYRRVVCKMAYIGLARHAPFTGSVKIYYYPPVWLREEEDAKPQLICEAEKYFEDEYDCLAWIEEEKEKGKHLLRKVFDLNYRG